MNGQANDVIRDSSHLPPETVRIPARGYAIDRGKALIVAAILWTGFAIMVWLVATGRTGRFDEIGLLAARRDADLGLVGSSLLLEIVRDVTALGGVFLRNLFAIGAVVALLFLKLRREALIFALTVATGWIANSAVKLLVGRERPEIVPHLMEAGGNSFPSGHSFSAAVVYIAMALAFASLSRRHSVRYTVIGAAMAISLMVAWSRVMLGVHFPSDVVAGWLGGAGWAFLAEALFYKSAKAAADSEAAQRIDPTILSPPPRGEGPGVGAPR